MIDELSEEVIDERHGKCFEQCEPKLVQFANILKSVSVCRMILGSFVGLEKCILVHVVFLISVFPS